MNKPTPPPGHPIPVDKEGYPRICWVCGEPALKTGTRAIEYQTTIDSKGRAVDKRTRHTDCQPGGSE